MDKFNSCLVVFIRVDKVWVLVSGMFLEQTLWKGIGIGEEEETFLGLLCLLGAGSLGEREEILSVAFDVLSLKGVFLGSSFLLPQGGKRQVFLGLTRSAETFLGLLVRIGEAAAVGEIGRLPLALLSLLLLSRCHRSRRDFFWSVRRYRVIRSRNEVTVLCGLLLLQPPCNFVATAQWSSPACLNNPSIPKST